MPFKILADENVNLNIVKFLRNQEIKVISIFEGYKSMPDVKILKLSTKLNALLLTEDSDFGEWIFAHKKKNIGVIFLRYESNEINDIINSLKIVLDKYKDTLYNKFIVITKNKIRIREINTK